MQSKKYELGLSAKWDLTIAPNGLIPGGRMPDAGWGRVRIAWLGIILCCKQKFGLPKNGRFGVLDSAIGPRPKKFAKHLTN